jgi:DNA-binding transcriptional MerR regulator/quercetin dioxygenase-like cupin family protein
MPSIIRLMKSRQATDHLKPGKSNLSLEFRISEAASILGISSSALRQWEAAGLAHPTRTLSGYRVYTLQQIENLKQIQHLRVDKGMNIDAIRYVMANTASPGPNNGKKSLHIAQPDQYIGRKLRRLRQQRGLSLAEASAKVGLSASFLSCLERGQVHASVSTLQKLSVLYNTKMLTFFENEKRGPMSRASLVHPNQRKRVSNEPGIEMELLAPGNALMEAHMFHLDPGTSSGGHYHHEGEEFVLVLKGEMEIWLDEVERFLLREGDCFYFSSMQTHRWSNPGKTKTSVLWVNTPPTF